MSTPAQVSHVPLFARLEEAGRQVNVKAHVEMAGMAGYGTGRRSLSASHPRAMR